MSEKEYEGYHTVSTVYHDQVMLVDQGQAEDVLVHDINVEPRVRTAEVSKRAGRVVVKLIAKEDNSVKDLGTVQSASKKVKQVEEEGKGGLPGPVESSRVSPLLPEAGSKPGPEEPAKAGGLGPVEVLKNFTDNIFKAHESRLKGLDSEQKISFFLGGLGATGFILALAALLKAFLG
jgi:hypothetical protein